MGRIDEHPILGSRKTGETVHVFVDGVPFQAIAGEPVAAALMAAGVKVFHRTAKGGQARGVFCAIGLCTDCLMTVDGVPNVRTCITPVREGMKIQTQEGLGSWESE